MRVRNAANNGWQQPQAVRVRNGANNAWDDRCVRVWDGSAWRDASTEIVFAGGTIDAFYTEGGGPSGQTTVTYGLDGTNEFGTQVTPNGGSTQFSRPWRTSAQCAAASEFEVALLAISGSDAGDVQGPALNVWTVMGANVIWSLSSIEPLKQATLTVGIRRAGNPTVLAQVNATLRARYEI